VSISSTTFEQSATEGPAAVSPRVPAAVQLVEVVSGPQTIVGLGEDCLVCEEGMEPGQVYVFCRDATGAGVAHESCTDPDPTGSDHPGRDRTDRAVPR
jgi:hypothetical protein